MDESKTPPTHLVSCRYLTLCEGFWIRPSFNSHSLSRSAKPQSHDSQLFDRSTAPISSLWMGKQYLASPPPGLRRRLPRPRAALPPPSLAAPSSLAGSWTWQRPPAPPAASASTSYAQTAAPRRESPRPPHPTWPPCKKARPRLTLGIRLISTFSIRCLMVRRWRLIGYFPILYNPTWPPCTPRLRQCAAGARSEGGGGAHATKAPSWLCASWLCASWLCAISLLQRCIACTRLPCARSTSRLFSWSRRF
jgi:hypothetical protein